MRTWTSDRNPPLASKTVTTLVDHFVPPKTDNIISMKTLDLPNLMRSRIIRRCSLPVLTCIVGNLEKGNNVSSTILAFFRECPVSLCCLRSALMKQFYLPKACTLAYSFHGPFILCTETRRMSPRLTGRLR